jgi:hypothetical protein
VVEVVVASLLSMVAVEALSFRRAQRRPLTQSSSLLAT